MAFERETTQYIVPFCPRHWDTRSQLQLNGTRDSRRRLTMKEGGARLASPASRWWIKEGLVQARKGVDKTTELNIARLENHNTTRSGMLAVEA